jgi:hypothetical protein
MMNYLKTIGYTLVILVLYHPVWGQEKENESHGKEKVNISAGLGIPELLFVGAKYQLEQTQIGLNIGTILDWSSISITSDVYYHFGGSSKLSSRRPWFVKSGYTYIREKYSTGTIKWLYLNLRIGRDINISKSLGIEVDVGGSFQLSHVEANMDSSYGWSLEYPGVPSFSIILFYRIL